ncbi:hypothetical protein K474DRAFT_1707884 [Panus rudis PR-1116 ss-1]|nr:hypothetical protein K474DRAFT_1707884 [Panus rudis PR-1116 ss-1]
MYHSSTKSFADKSRGPERLDVEDEEQRQERMHNVFMRLDSQTSQKTQDAPRKFEFGDRRTYAVEPPSELLSRVQSFLPQLAASNEELTRRAQEDPSSVDIENVGEDSGYIEMNLGLGVFEERGGKSKRSRTGNHASDSPDVEMSLNHNDAAASSTSSGNTDSTSRSDSGMSEDEDSYSDTSSIDIISTAIGSVIARPIRPLPRRSTTRPEIVVLNDDGHSKDTGSSSSSAESQ